jgi:hypothetical protein
MHLNPLDIYRPFGDRQERFEGEGAKKEERGGRRKKYKEIRNKF